jgi:hypothetical protein
VIRSRLRGGFPLLCRAASVEINPSPSRSSNDRRRWAQTLIETSLMPREAVFLLVDPDLLCLVYRSTARLQSQTCRSQRSYDIASRPPGCMAAEGYASRQNAEPFQPAAIMHKRSAIPASGSGRAILIYSSLGGYGCVRVDLAKADAWAHHPPVKPR